MHLVEWSLAPTDFVLIEVEIPDSVLARAAAITPEKLHEGWQSAGSHACIERGEAWLTAPRHPAICRVPSAVTPETENLLLDPAHRDAKRVRVRSVRAWRFDARLLRG